MRYIFIPILIFFTSVSVSAQVATTSETTTQNQPQSSYVLKDIVVDGVKKFSPAQILRFTGLSKGEMVEIPGQKVSNAIKKLWESDSFSEVEVYVEDIDGQNVVLKFRLQDLMELGEVKFKGKGIGKSKNEKLIKDNSLKPGTKITNNLISTLSTKIPEEYKKKGFAGAKITIQDKVNANDPNLIDWTIQVDKGKKIKIAKIEFEGNEQISDTKLKKKGFKDTKQKTLSLKGIFKPSKFIREKYDEDKVNLIKYYNSLGFRDARILSDSVWRNDKGFNINVKLNEGKKYYIGDISFIGNTSYST